MYPIQHVLIPKLINKSIVIDYQTTYDDDRITGEYQTFIVSFAYSNNPIVALCIKELLQASFCFTFIPSAPPSMKEISLYDLPLSSHSQ